MTDPLTSPEKVHKHRLITTADGQCIVAERGYALETIEALLEDGEELTLGIIEMTDSAWEKLPGIEQ